MGEVTLLGTQVDTRPAADVNRHSRRTLAEKRTGCVDALPIDAHSRKHLTFIHIFTRISSDSSKAFTTDWIFFTFSTRAVPGFSQCGAAVGLERSSVDVNLTSIVDHLQPARALGSLYALQSRAVQ